MGHSPILERQLGPRLVGRLSALGQGLIDLLYPPRCAGCGRVGALFCAACQARIEPLPAPACPHCGQPRPDDELCPECRAAPSHLDAIRATAIFAHPLRDAIHALKYNNAAALAGPLGARMAVAWQAAGLSADLIMPVPLHRGRLAERGYNQAALLARVLGRTAGVPVDERSLARQRATAHQVGLGRADRQVNVAGAFACQRGLAGLRVALVDDVCTTGSTLEACAKAVRAAGASSVWAFTLARARWAPGQITPPDTLTP